MISGWALAALCVNVIRTPDPADATKSKFVVIPKPHLGINQTYVDARDWTLADVQDHSELVSRLLEAGKAEQLKFLADPKSKEDLTAQITDAMTGRIKVTVAPTQPSTNKSPTRMGKM
jgi:hypothetical protein